MFISVFYSFDCFLVQNCFYSLNEKKKKNCNKYYSLLLNLTITYALSGSCSNSWDSIERTCNIHIIFTWIYICNKMISYELLFDILSALFVLILLTFYACIYAFYIKILCSSFGIHFTDISCTFFPSLFTEITWMFTGLQRFFLL